MLLKLNRQRAHAELGVGGKGKELADVARKLDGLIEAIADGLRAPGLQAKLDDLDRRKRALEAERAAASAPAIRLHPNLADVYRRKVEALQEAVADPATGTEALEAVRGLIERVVVTPTESKRQL
jgi:site-specific DNA recombinase